jgi:hypothetical protein
MTWHAEHSIPEGFRWWCRKMVAGVRCSGSRPMKHGSWFQQNNLTFLEILEITWHCMPRTCPPDPRRTWLQFQYRRWLGHVLQGNNAGVHGGVLWRRSAVLTRPLRLMRASSVGESTIGDTLLRASGYLAVSGRTFFTTVPDRTADTLVAILRDWV